MSEIVIWCLDQFPFPSFFRENLRAYSPRPFFCAIFINFIQNTFSFLGIFLYSHLISLFTYDILVCKDRFRSSSWKRFSA